MAFRRSACAAALQVTKQLPCSQSSACTSDRVSSSCCSLMSLLWESYHCSLLLKRRASHHTATLSAQQHECASDCTDHHHGHQRKQSLSFEQQEQECWNCHDRYHRGGLICRSCDRIQPVDSSLTYFDLMGYQQPTFDVEPAALEKRYKLLQWHLHPDKTVMKAEQEQEYSAQQASLINQAYGVLRNPLSRANYLLMLQGMTEAEREGTIADPELLMEVMEARELVDQEDDQERLVKLHTANKQRQAAIISQLSRAFADRDAEAAKQLVAQLSYWVRLEEAICEKL